LHGFQGIDRKWQKKKNLVTSSARMYMVLDVQIIGWKKNCFVSSSKQGNKLRE
jgi:hypothetical protein